MHVKTKVHPPVTLTTPTEVFVYKAGDTVPTEHVELIDPDLLTDWGEGNE